MEILNNSFHRYGLKGKRGSAHPNSQKTHCPHGHPYSEENTYVREGRRTCRECRRVRNSKRPVGYRRGPYKPRRSKIEQVIQLSERDFKWPMNTIVMERGGKYKEKKCGQKDNSNVG